MRSDRVISSLLETSGQQSEDGNKERFSKESMDEFSEANLRKMLDSKYRNNQKILDEIRNCPSPFITINSLLINNLSKEEEAELEKAITENKNLRCLTINDTTGKLIQPIMKGVAANPNITALDFHLELEVASAKIVLDELSGLLPRKLYVTFTDIFSINSSALIKKIESISAPAPKIPLAMQRFIENIQYMGPTVLIDSYSVNFKETFSEEELNGIVSALANNKHASILKFAAHPSLIPSVIEGVRQNLQIQQIDVTGVHNDETLQCILTEIQNKLSQMNIEFNPEFQQEFFNDHIKRVAVIAEMLPTTTATKLSM